jgi:hypothetical protein
VEGGFHERADGGNLRWLYIAWRGYCHTRAERCVADNQFDRAGEKRHFSSVSTQEIIAELPKLNRQELEEVNSKLRELLAAPAASDAVRRGLKRFAGVVHDLPSDMARNHDHYLHGRPKK